MRRMEICIEMTPKSSGNVAVMTVFIGICIITAAIILAPAGNDRDLLYQVSTLDALMAGVYEGDVPFSDLKEYGDLGLGTVDALNGELVIADGGFYRISTDGAAHRLSETDTTPFAAITWFDPDYGFSVKDTAGRAEIEEEIVDLLPSENYFYAIRIDGSFASVTARSVPRQEPPYRPLLEVIAEQSVYTFEDVEGSLVGFWSPAYASGIGVSGFHLHFLSADKTKGGHMTNFTLASGTVAIDTTPRFEMELPEGTGFASAAMGGARQEIAKVEK